MYPKLIEQAIESLRQLPGVGRRSAERMVFWILNNDEAKVRHLSDSLVKVKENLGFCRKCFHLSEDELCLICQDPSRDASTVCVVEDSKDVLAIEKAGVYKGLYHVLLGNISPSEGRGPEHLKIHALMERIKNEPIKEIVIATDPDAEGEMTALFLIKQLSALDVKVSRIGVGLAMGSSVEYADASSLSASISSRRDVKDVSLIK